MQGDKTYYENFFKKYGANAHNQPDRYIKIAELCKGRVLDLGCGTGYLSDYYTGSYAGVDISEEAVSIAKKLRRKDARFFAADMLRSEIELIEKVDTVVMAEFLEHIVDDSVLFIKLKKLLKDDGIIICSVPNGDRVPDESHVRIFTVPIIRRMYAKYGKVTFRNWSGFKDRIVFTIEPGRKSMNLMTLVMIVKNEAKGIENAIISALEIVDNVVVSIDDATTDNTAEIAQKYADVLKNHLLEDDFSKARNKAQQNVKSKWILFLDGHEYIEKTGRIDNLLNLDVDGILVTVKMENGSSFMFPRIFRSHIKFENAVHNAPDVKTQQYAPKFVIVHDRENLQSKESAKERQKQRDRMVPNLMKERLKSHPKDQRALFNLANWYMTKNESKLAIEIYKRCYKLTPSPDERYFLKAQIGIAQQLLGQKLRATWSFFDLEKLIPDRWETKRLIGGAYLQRGQYNKALAYLVGALGQNTKQYIYQLFGQDLSEIWDLIGHCFNLLGQNAQAVIAWEQARNESKDKKRQEYFETKARFAKMLLPQINATMQELNLKETQKRGAVETVKKE